MHHNYTSTHAMISTSLLMHLRSEQNQWKFFLTGGVIISRGNHLLQIHMGSLTIIITPIWHVKKMVCY